MLLPFDVVEDVKPQLHVAAHYVYGRCYCQEVDIPCSNTFGNNIQKQYMVIPYYKELSESLKKACSKHGVQVYFKGGNTIKNLLVVPKDQDPVQKKSGVIYRYRLR